MSQPAVASYGTWHSPITADLIAKKDILVDPITSNVYHIEKRPTEGGRNVIVKTSDGIEAFGAEWNARTAVQEYGGASAIVHNDIIYFSNFKDGRVYKIDKGKDPVPITPENQNHRFANFAIHPIQANLIVAILEDHTNPAPADVVTTLVVIDTNASKITTFASGADFYSSPAFNQNGSKIAWTQWNHPDMPWEGSEVFVAFVEIENGTLRQGVQTKIAGQKGKHSAAYPSWSNNNTLPFTYDLSGYQNPWICHMSSTKSPEVGPLLALTIDEDFGEPAWSLGDSCYAVLDEKSVLFTALKGGRTVLYYTDDISRKQFTLLNSPYVDAHNLRRLSSKEVIFLGKKADEEGSIVLLSLNDALQASFKTLKNKSAVDADSSKLSKSLVSLPQPITLRVPPNNASLHIAFYPPMNPAYVGPENEKPPCVIHVHGGPTGKESLGLDWRKQYFTTRGWSWVDVNYGGSSGYGRKYTDRLVGKWGIVDVEDCIQAVRKLSSPPYNLIDPKRAVIRGGSAGGFTVLAAMCAASDVFAAGTSSFGVSDLNKLVEFTHKFESHYLVKLVGGTPEEVPEVYRERSPVFHADKIKSPLLILQGSLDAVVPPQQAEDIVKSIKDNKGYVGYILFEGEGHGWRKAENIIAALEKELEFYMNVFGLKTHVL